MKTIKQFNIFIVEDNELYARSLHLFLLSSFPNINTIKVFNTGEQCLLELRHNPEIVIMDYFLNSKYQNAKNGLEIIKNIKTQCPHAFIIVLSSQENYDIVFKAIQQYDCFYVQKDHETFSKVTKLINNFDYKKSLIFERKNML